MGASRYFYANCLSLALKLAPNRIDKPSLGLIASNPWSLKSVPAASGKNQTQNEEETPGSITVGELSNQILP